MRWRSLIVVLILISPSVAAQDLPKPRSPVPASDDLYPDPNWEPTPGDRAEVTRDNAPAALNYPGYQRYLVSLKASDTEGLNKLGGMVVKLPKGTAVHILRGFRPEKPRDGVRVQSDEEYLREILTAPPREDYSELPVEVRVLEGPAKGSVRLVPESFLASLIKRPYPKGYIHASEPGFLGRRFVEFPTLPRSAKGTTTELRVANLYHLGAKAERSGDIGGAIACYLAIKFDFPETPEAKRASDRMDAMGVSQLPSGDYIYDPFARGARKKAGGISSRSTTDPSKRAESLLTMAKNLEKLKKANAALETYQSIIREHPMTPSATEAAERIKVLAEAKAK